jgi:hypothetical protein
MRHAACAAAVIALLHLPPSLAAQSGAENAVLAAWDDSLARLSDAARIGPRDVMPRPTGGARDLVTALAQLRKAELTNNRGLVELALIRLAATSASHRNWPWPDYLIARTFFRLAERDAKVIASAGLIEGENHIEAAWRNLRTALATDPTFAPARRLAETTLLAEGDRDLRNDERAVLTVLLAWNPDADALLIAARDARSRSRYDSALAFLDRAITSQGDVSRLQLERARGLQALGDSVGAAAAYWDGVAHLSAVGREMYHHDLAWIMAPDSLEQFDAVPPDSVADWLHRFWLQRDAAAANRFGERLQEHLRRWNYAFAHFRVASPWRHNMFRRVEYGFEGVDGCIGNDSQLYALLAREQPTHPDDVRRHEPLLDHRGLILMHHGSPVRVVYGPGSIFESDTLDATNFATDQKLPTHSLSVQLDPSLDLAHLPGDPAWAAGTNESWLYWIDGGWRVLNFRGSAAFGRYGATTLTSYLPINLGDWLARAGLTPVLADAAYALYAYRAGTHGLPPTCRLEKLRLAIATSRADADVATRTDSDTPLVLRPWSAVIRAYALGSGADKSGEALVTFAIPFSALHTTGTLDGTPYYDVAARIVGYERRTGRTFAIDTVRHYAAAGASSPQAHLSGWFEFPLEPGDWQLAFRFSQNDSIGAYALASHLDIDTGANFSLSDVVIGSSAGVSWPAPDGAPFPLNVLGAWTPAGPAEVYYELRGLPANQEYHAVIEVREVEAKATNIVRVESVDRATGPVTRVRKTLGLQQLRPGLYRVIMTFDAGGRRVTREQQLLVVNGK